MDLVSVLTDAGNGTNALAPGWAAHHSSGSFGVTELLGINTISPLINAKVATLDTSGHCMLLNIDITKVINPGQTSVDISDQPIYALTQGLQFAIQILLEIMCHY